MAGVYQQAVVEFPNGEKHTFVPKDSSLPYYRLASVRDSFGNGFDIAYAANVWTITDTLGRQHKAFFDYVHPVLGRQLTQLQLAGFNGTQAVFTFSYAVPPYQEPGGTATGFLARSTKHQYNCSVCWKNQALPPPWVQVAFLTKVTLPDGSAFGLGDGENLGDYYALIPPSCTPPSLPAPDYPGVLKKLRLPTGGTYTWTWGKWQNAPGNVSCYNHAEELALVQDLLGVVRKDIANPMPGGTQAGSWLYQHTVPCTLSDGQPDPDCQESWTAVTDPLGNVTKHYFRTRYCLQSPDYGWDYGLPYTMGPQGQSTSPPFKSVEYYRGATTLLRTAYVTYEHDALVPIQDAQYLPWKWHDSNRRVKFEQTTYADDGGRIATVSYSNFDGLGHYRQVQTGGSFPGNNVRTTFVNYNPTRGVYPGSFVPPSPNDPWVLGTFSYRQQTEGSFQQFEQSCFEASTGFLLRSRTYKNPPYQASADVIVRFSRDTAGNTVREERFGGDLQAVPTGDLCSLALPTAWYRVDHSYQYGVRNQSVVVDAATGVAFPFKLLDQDIDFATGLVKTSRDVSGLATTYEYDAMARVSWVKPQLGHDGWVRFVYTNASATTPAKVDVYVLPNGSTNLSQALARMAWEFDGFGRPYGEYRRMPGGTWVQRKTNYNALGWTVKSSEWDPYGTPDSGPNGMKWTETTSFDPFGRPERVVAPDGKVTTFSYAGVRLTTVQATVATQANGVETTATVTREFDRFGRLVKVTEPSGSGGSMVSTSYVYDVAGRLRQATTAAGAITQNRVWTYDGRGYLQAEQLPEKGPSGNGVVQYLGYDALGHATRVVDGSQDLAYVYDKAGRLVQVKQASGAVLAEYTYGAANSGSNYALGKLVLAVRHNATDYGDEVVSESFTYGGRMGRLSGKQTQLALRYPRLETRTFVQSFVWNELGDLASQGYPDDQGLADPARLISYGYDNGYLTAVGGFVTSQVYHANGMVFRRSLANGVMEEVALDSSKMARPGQMRVVGPSGQEYWNSGTFVYDGVGNVKALVRSSTDQDVYVYDLVSRLVYARFKTAGGGTKEESLSYDAFGNLLSSVTPPTDYGSRSWSVDGVNRLAGCGYDAAGRMTACGGLTLSWTAAGELGKVQGTGINRSFLYTASGEKIMVRNELLGTAAVSLRDLGGNPVRHYLYSGGSWSWLGDDIFVGRLRIAQVTSSGTRYFHVDHLGSVRRVSTGAGALEKAYDFFPYGLPVKETVGQERLWFASYELEHQNTPDYTDDLYFLHARWYFPYMARFLSADPVRGDPAQPQSLNLYAYVRGNPLNALDPDGRTAQVGTVTYRPDLDKLLKQLTAKTGYLFAVKNGKIVIVGDLLKDGKVLRSEVSGIARALVAEMINSSRTFVVNIVRNDRDIIGGKATRETLSDHLIGRESGITIDAGDLASAEFHNVPEATFDLSMAFLHEAGHVVRGLSDPSPWLGRFTGDLGEVEKLILNPIRQKLGLPKRGDYVSRRDGQRFTVLFEGGYVDYENF